MDGEPNTNLFVKPRDIHQFLDPTSSHPNHCKKEFLTVKLGSAQIMRNLINVVTIWKNGQW